ncbi:hypothetical protein ESZ00_08595 [Silvibacterium dinghuense]|uniref:DUF4136 domain-containing protein n=2 Tax=Silvibacterium dinghuense TaxID=1560006 RepID=A0A4Q1SKL4_9BACT|nr:hypothetical protein ESZ00_08595 [Silvibacterium dinghuense]
MRAAMVWFCLAAAALPMVAQENTGSTSEAKPGSAAAAPVTPGPIPAAIGRAKKVFVSNEGSDGGLFPHPFSGTESRAYDQFYAALQQWGRYELVDNPAEADLVFDVRLLAPKGPLKAEKINGTQDPLPELRLVIYDRPTHYALWAITRQVDLAFLQKTHDRNFNEAMDALMSDLKHLTGQDAANKGAGVS